MQSPIETARALGEKGDLEAAEKLLAEATKTQQGRADAALNHLYGQVLHDLGKLDRAITHYRRALRISADAAEVHRDLGVAYQSKAWHKEAAECFQEAIRLAPADELAHTFIGRSYQAQGAFLPALIHFVRAASLKITAPFRRRVVHPAQKHVEPENPDKETLAHARAALEAGRLAEAEQLVRGMIARDARNADAFALAARIWARTNRLEAAIDFARRALQEDPENAERHFHLGELLAKAERGDEAASSIENALRIDSASAKFHAGLALVEYMRERPAQAEQHARLAVNAEPGSAHANNVRGYLLITEERFSEAERFLRESIRLAPERAGAYLNLAHSLKEQGRIDEARAAVQEGASRLTDEANSYCHLSAFDLDMGDIPAAIQHARRALALEPSHADAHISLCNLLLLSERYEEGWQEFEWRKRYRVQARVHDFFRARTQNARQWLGTPLEGKTLLVHCEQALGEQILFSSCLPEVLERAAGVTFLCNERLTSLLSRSFPRLKAVAVQRGDRIADYRLEAPHDFWCALGSLPGLLKRDQRTIPGPTAYLKPDPVRVERWQKALRDLGPGPKVGISWRGGKITTGRLKRSLDLMQLQPLLDVPGIRWISMQYTESEAELAAARSALGIEITHWQEAIDDFEEHAALAAALDHRISVCNTLVHLSGAMGLSTWVLSPPATIWPYGLGEQMPWYPSVRIYRQQRYKDWVAPLERMASDLRSLVAECDARPRC